MVNSFLEEDRQYLNEKLTIIGELAAGMAHEIRNPLTSIRGFLQLIQSKYDPNAMEQEYFAIIFSELDRINDIIKEFLALAKPSQAQLQITAFDQLLAEILLLAEQEAVLHEVCFTKDIAPDMPLLCLNPDQIKQVILNITSNAFQATGRGGEVIVRSRFDDTTKQLITIVEDNGPGIPPDKLELIFEPFYTTKETGTGLGLTLSKRIIESHGGKIKVTSAINKGSRFLICLPVT
jgi:signal transduction histidine kinase